MPHLFALATALPFTVVEPRQQESEREAEQDAPDALAFAQVLSEESEAAFPSHIEATSKPAVAITTPEGIAVSDSRTTSTSAEAFSTKREVEADAPMTTGDASIETRGSGTRAAPPEITPQAARPRQLVLAPERMAAAQSKAKRPVPAGAIGFVEPATPIERNVAPHPIPGDGSSVKLAKLGSALQVPIASPPIKSVINLKVPAVPKHPASAKTHPEQPIQISPIQAPQSPPMLATLSAISPAARTLGVPQILAPTEMEATGAPLRASPLAAPIPAPPRHPPTPKMPVRPSLPHANPAPIHPVDAEYLATRSAPLLQSASKQAPRISQIQPPPPLAGLEPRTSAPAPPMAALRQGLTPLPAAKPPVQTATASNTVPFPDMQFDPLDPGFSPMIRTGLFVPNSASSAITLPNALAASVAGQIASSIPTTALLQGGSTQIALNPEELGRIRMTFTTTDTGITVAITAERPETADLMRRNINLLQQEFAQMQGGELSFTFEQQTEHSGGTDSESSARDLDPDTEDHAHPPDTPRMTATASGGLNLKL